MVYDSVWSVTLTNIVYHNTNNAILYPIVISNRQKVVFLGLAHIVPMAAQKHGVLAPKRRIVSEISKTPSETQYGS